jgi:hypothetical protein
VYILSDFEALREKKMRVVLGLYNYKYAFVVS